MRTIKISDAVWNVIAAKGKFGETEDDVLRRELGLPPIAASEHDQRRAGSTRFAVKRMSARVQDGKLAVEFDDGAKREWLLANKSDKSALRAVLTEALDYAISQGASDPGQTNAVRKALTEAGFHLTRR